MNEKILEVISKKRERITSAREKLGDLLAYYNRLYQKAEDFLQEKNAVPVIEADLIEETKKIFSDLEQDDDSSIDFLLTDKFSSSRKHGQAVEEELDENNAVDENSAEAGKDDSDDENQKDGANQEKDGELNIPASVGAPDESPAIADDLKHLPLPAAVFVCLDTTFPAKQSVKWISDILIVRGFGMKPRELYEKIRAALRHYEKRNIFARDAATWGVAEQYHGGNVAELFDKTKQGEVSRNNLTDAGQKGDRTITEYCEEILKKSGQQWLHVNQILTILKNEYDIVRDKANVASVLRKNAKNKRIFKFYGKNRFGLLEQVVTVKSVSA